jgi:hypothetical protein
VAQIGDAVRVVHLSIRANLKCAARAHVPDLIDTCGHYNTNRRRTFFMHISYLMPTHAPTGCGLHPRASQDLAAIFYLQKQHIIGDTHAHMEPSMEITHSYTFNNQILHKVYCFDQINLI